MRRGSSSIALLALIAGCGAEPVPELEPVAHEFPRLPVAAGEEISDLCQSWSIGNDEPLYVNTVAMTAGPGWHHSNWFFVPEDSFAGEDGTWVCRDRDFDQVEAALVGGVLYAQSTQSVGEEQAFRPGAAVIVPPRSKIVGQIHLLNASDAAVDTSIELSLDRLRPEEVDTILTPLELHYYPLRLPPAQPSSFGADCDYEAAYGAPVSFEIHYVMPHYHDLGLGMTIELFGGERDGELVFESDSPVGTPMGGTLETPLPVSGSRGLRFRCDYDNPREQPVGWGIGDQEMCVALLFTDSEVMWAGGVESGRVAMGESGGVARFGGDCDLYTLRARY